MANAGIDQNSRATLTALSSVGDGSIVTLYANPVTHRLLVDYTGGGGVTSVSVVSANGFAGTVATPTTTPAITLTTTNTVGSVLFAGTSGTLGQNNTNLFFDNTLNRLGVGLNTPETTLHTEGAATLFSSNNVGILTIGTPQKSGAYKSRIFIGIDNTTNTSSGSAFIQSREIQVGANTNLYLNPSGGSVVINANTSIAGVNEISLLVGATSSNNGYIRLQNTSSYGGGATPYTGLLFQQSAGTANTYIKGAVIFNGYDGAGYCRGQLLFAVQATASALNVQDDLTASTRMNIDYQTGAVSIGKGVTVGTAKLHLGAGTATASTAPLKIDSGVALTTAEDGAIEYHSSHLYFTVGTTRYQLDQQGGTGANSLGTYIVQTATNAPANGQVLGSLSTGIIKNTTTTGVLSIAVAADFPTLNQNTTGSAATVTTNANLTGVITSVGNATSIASQTGTGTKFVVDTSPTLITPNLGTPTSGVVTNLTGTASININGTVGATTPATATFTTATSLQDIYTQNSITASANAATVPITHRLHKVTNNSAATLTITFTTTSAVDGQLCMVRILDFSAVAQTLTLVNTENSLVTPPALTNGSTTLPLTIGLQYNSATAKWRIIATS